MSQTRWCVLALLFVPLAAFSYDIDTHAWMANQSFQKSILLPQASPLRERLGFDRLDDSTPFRVYFELQTLGNRDAYLDLVPGATFGSTPNPYIGPHIYRAPTDFERQSFTFANGPAPLGSASGLAPTPYNFAASFVRGAVREDDLRPEDYTDGGPYPDLDPYGPFLRVANHFFDPINNLPLVLPVGLTCNGSLDTPCNRSLDWAIGVSDAQSLNFSPAQDRRNHFSWIDARDSFWQALTFKSSSAAMGNYAARQAQDSGIRRNFWHSALKSVGHVSHLLQDTSQPQHTRNDRHNPGAVVGTTLARRTMELYANYRVTGTTTSVPSDEVEQFRAMFNGPGSERLLSVPPIGNYPIPQFSTPTKFFTTRHEDGAIATRRGLADYSNRGFYTHGTSPPGSGFASPPNDPQDPSFSIVEGEEYSLPGFGATIAQRFFWQVPDPVAPSYVDTCAVNGKMPMGNVSALQNFAGTSTAPVPANIVLALDDLRCHQDALLPRGIAYTTGLINFFFRGELEITAPPQRLLAVLDQGTPHTVDADGYPRRTDNNEIFGFKKVRLSLRNTTPSIVESGGGNTYTQTLGGSNGPSSGRIVAVARYHRNPCYRPDMTGERRVVMPFTGGFQPPSGCPAVGSRTRYQEISVSTEMAVSPGEFGFGPNSSFVDKNFDFAADPIPVNATDLFIQVVYRGPLGAEPDGIALGTYDAREPMFALYWNNTDYYNANGSWLGSGAGVFRKGVKDFQFCAGAGTDRVVLARRINATTGQPAMSFPEPAEFMRFAVITAKPVTTENVVFRGNASFFEPQPPVAYSPRITGIKGTINQANKELIDVVTEPFPLPSNPLADCPTTPPQGTSFLWCVEPIRVRRGLAGGKVDEAIYLDNVPAAASPPDPGTLPNFVQTPVQRAGENLWDQDPLVICPNSITDIPALLDAAILFEEGLSGGDGRP